MGDAPRPARKSEGSGLGGAVRTLVASLVLANVSVHAQSVSLTGMMGPRALLVIDGGTPRSAAPGETVQGVRVISTEGDVAVVEFAGQRQTLRVGETPVSVGPGGPAANGRRAVLRADSRGHFMAEGRINGQPVSMMVDTGATLVAIGINDAQRLGINPRAGQPTTMGTANGTARGWRLLLRSVRVEDVEVQDVEAVVTEAPMPFVLLGNSFLNRFRMQRDDTQLLLDRRY